MYTFSWGEGLLLSQDAQKGCRGVRDHRACVEESETTVRMRGSQTTVHVLCVEESETTVHVLRAGESETTVHVMPCPPYSDP